MLKVTQIMRRRMVSFIAPMSGNSFVNRRASIR